MVYDDHPHNVETFHLQLTIGRNKLDLHVSTFTQFANLVTTKCLLNSIISTYKVCFINLDINNFYYGTSMEYCNYMQITFASIMKDIADQSNLD